MAATGSLIAERQSVDQAPGQLDGVDKVALIAMLRERNDHIRALEAECRELASQLVAFRSEILRWVDLDR
jgi:hypothetical protein